MNYYKGISIPVRHLGQILDQAVKYFPEKIALRDDNEHEITFAELQEKTTRFAQNLVEQGVASGNIIMVVTEKYVEVVIIAISIWKAGGIFAPVDSKNPPDRIRLFSSNLRPFFIIASQIKLKELKDVIDCHNTISFSQVRSGVFYNFSEKQLPFVNSNDLAVILQTSGTTGKPKGVELEHGSVLVYFKGHRDICEISDKSKSINIGPFHYDVSIQNVFMPLYYGAFVYITKGIPHPSYILSIIERNKISHILCVATVLSIITGDGSILHEYDLSSVEMVSTGAEICNPEIIHIWLKLPNVKVNNTYGPAECNSASISYRIPKYINNDNQKIYPIGKPHPTVDFLLLDQKKNLITKKDDPGMLYIGGAQLMRGYMDDVSETKRKIIDHKGKRYYKTGDLCFLDVEGNLNYVGRIDSEVNIFGRRINLTEIEKNYLKINGVNAASVGLVDVNNKKTISVVICIDEQLTVGDVHKELKSRLPYYMLPSYYGIIEKPVIGNTGKINGRKLLDLLSQSILSKDVICYNYENVDFYYYNEGREYFRGANEEGKKLEGSFPVRGGAENQLSVIWSIILNKQQVGRDENFFDLGGTSVEALTLLNRIQQQFGKRLSPASLFQAQTIAEQAEIIQHSSSLEPIQLSDSRKTAQSAPLTFAQERIHLLQQLEPESPAYNRSLIRRLKGPLNITALEQSLQEILRRHEVLRTILPAQELMPVPPEQIPVTDCRSFPEPAAEARRLVGEEMNRPFDLSTGPLLRTRLFRLDRDDHVLFLGTHQVCCDDQSTGILLRELTALYAAFAQGQPSPLPEPPVQYADYAGWQRDRLQGEVLEEQLAFWREQLRPPVPRLNLSTNRHSRAVARSLDIPARLHDALRTLSREQGTTLFMTLLAAFQTLLFRCTMQEDILVFSSVGGRNRTEIKGLIGLFTNVLALRTDLSGNPAFRELLGRIRETALAAFSHQDLPFEQLLDLLHAGSGQAPPLQVLFVLQNAAMPELDLPGVQVEPFRVDTEGTSQFDMVWYFKETDAGLTAWLRYRTELSGLATVMAKNMQTILQGIVAAPDQRLTDLPCLSEEERQGLPVFINQDQTIAEADRPGPESYVAPRNPQEQQLILIWEAVLKTAPVGIHDNFFDLGGTSVAALSLLNRVQQHFGRDLSLAMLFQARTVAEQAEIVRQKGERKAWTSLVPIRASGGRKPFFLIPGGGGGHNEFIIYERLARRLDAEQPVCILLARGLDDGRKPHTKIEEMAADYLDEICKVQPEGPYLLGGECIGGAVAFETACQLREQGREVGLLVLMDTPYPSGETQLHSQRLIQPLIKRIRHHRTALLELVPEKRWDYLKEKGRKALWTGAARIWPTYTPPEIQLRIQLRQLGDNYQKAIQCYRPGPYPGHLVLIISDEGLHARRSFSEWERLAAHGAEIHTVPGDHLSYLREHVHTTAEQLQTCLNKAQQDNTFSPELLPNRREFSRKKEQASALMPLQPKGSKPPFFYIPPAGSTALGGAKFAQYLGTDQPFYGLQPLGFDEGETPHNRVEDMAAYYIRAIRSVQPEGPYYLGGICFGVHVAFEMAQQLHKQGETVAMLAMFDAIWWPVDGFAPKRGFEKITYYALEQGHKNLTNTLISYFVFRPLRKIKKVFYLFSSLQYQRIQYVTTEHHTALMQYTPAKYPGKITLFQSSQYYTIEEKKEIPRPRWDDLATGGLDRHVIQGAHIEVLGGGPQFQELLKKFKTCLDKAQQDNAAAHTP